MGKLEGMIRSEIVRLAKREVRKISLPLGKEVRSLKGTLSQLRKTMQSVQRFAAQKEAESRKQKIVLESPTEEITGSRFSPRLIRTLRKRLGITQKELAQLLEVTVGAIHQWEGGKFEPRDQKKGMMIALRKMGRRQVRAILEKKEDEKGETKRTRRSRRKR